MRLKGKVALITGGASGIGSEAAALFAEEGASVVIADQSDNAEETLEKITKVDGIAKFVQGDVSNNADASRMVRTALDEYDRMDILFNNAGFNVYGSVDNLPLEDWNRLTSTIMTGTFLVSKYALKHMMTNGGGCIVNNASTFGIIAQENDPAYCAAKGGVISLTRQMALDYAKYNIRVNCICPGPTLTPRMKRRIVQSPNSNITEQRIVSRIPLKRFAHPREIALAALFLASDEASFVTGATLVVDGGQTIHNSSSSYAGI